MGTMFKWRSWPPTGPWAVHRFQQAGRQGRESSRSGGGTCGRYSSDGFYFLSEVGVKAQNRERRQ